MGHVVDQLYNGRAKFKKSMQLTVPSARQLNFDLKKENYNGINQMSRM